MREIFGTDVSESDKESEIEHSYSFAAKRIRVSDVERESDLDSRPQTNVAKTATKPPKAKKEKTAQKKAAVTGWSPKPKAVSAYGNPCQRKKLELMRPVCPIKKHLASQAVVKTPTQEHVSVSGPTVMNPCVPSTSTSLLKYAEAWPLRKLPSVRDIVAYRRNVVPLTATPGDVGQLAGIKFGWHNKPIVTAERYVQGVVAGYDHARRVVLDELSQFVAGQPETKDVVAWVNNCVRPPSPKQNFDD